MLGNRSIVTLAELRERLGISWATLTRDLAYMKDCLNAPITYHRDLGGYRFGKGPRTGTQYELPGLWFTAEEIHALLTMQHPLLDGCGDVPCNVEDRGFAGGVGGESLTRQGEGESEVMVRHREENGRWAAMECPHQRAALWFKIP
ncbi:MAG: hypothetical protein NFV80_04030 [Candidatus Accumulibacter sp.]|nr:hypothetical protein [Accumulibacter sp.]